MYSEPLGNTFIAEKSMVLMHNINSVKYVMHFYRVFMGVQQNITLKMPSMSHQRHDKCCSYQVLLKY